ncbi:MAG: hypothetical protein QXS23_01440 [Desulfurococcaceae archaeon]
MTLYWDRCDICGSYRPTKRCSMYPDISIDIHCCITCTKWFTVCKNPAWSIKIVEKPMEKTKEIRKEERDKLLRELTSMLEQLK